MINYLSWKFPKLFIIPIKNYYNKKIFKTLKNKNLKSTLYKKEKFYSTRILIKTILKIIF